MADVVGFSKMMGRDEERTIELILEFHERVKEGIERHGGRVVGTAGDSVFGDFDSIVEAMELAAEMQQTLHDRNLAAPAEEQIVARIGLHLGDVIVEEYTVFGDGVNIAARLEQLADPGGILVSEAVYQQVKSHSDLPFEEVGTRELKNIEQPIRLYRVGPEAFGGDVTALQVIEPVPPTPVVIDSGAGVRDLIGAIADEVRAEIADTRVGLGDAVPTGSQPPNVSVSFARPRHSTGIGAFFDPATLMVLTLGVLGVLARTTEWTTNAIYPALGTFLIGSALGRLLEGLSGKKGVGRLIRAIGLGFGAVFFGEEAVRAAFWVLAVAMFGSSIQSLRHTGT
jgi:hypothetical protein